MTTTRFMVPAMDCATEKEIISNRLGRIDAVEGLDFDLLDRVVTVRHREGTEGQVEAALRDIGMKPERIGDGVAAATGGVADACCAGGDARTSAAPAPDHRKSIAGAAAWTRGAWLLGVAGACALAGEVVAWITGDENSWPVIALAMATLALCGPQTFRKGIVALRTFTLNINLLMTIAVVGAIAIGQWPEAAMVTFLFAVAELIESRSVDRARDAIRSLMALSPETALVRKDTQWVEVPAAGVTSGQVIRVRPGERVPLDGRVIAGTTAIDQAPITGESVPVDKVVGDQVFAGTINQQGAIEVEVTAAQGDSTLARIARTIREAQSQKAPTERFVDQFSKWYTPLVVLFAIGVAVGPPLIVDAAFQPWLYKALVLLVIACPCALVISTPVTVVSGLAAAARRGILVKGGVHLEQARKLRAIALDKTGTLTEGKPALVDVVPLADVSRDELLQRAASLEATSTHPIAQAVVRGWTGDLLPVADSSNVVGKGLRGTVANAPLAIGSHRLAEESGVCGPDVERELGRLEAEGKSVMVVWSDRTVLGILAVADTVRQTSIDAIRALHSQGLRLVMLTGDNPTTAAAVAQRVGIDQVEASLLPEDKLAAIDKLAAAGPVGMVGDGVNDAPALARATIGFAMGAAGTDTALETADVALMKDDLRGVSELVDLSRKTAFTLTTNISLAIGIKAVFFVLALLDVATLWMAVFADMGASLLVAANGLRLLRAGSRGSR
jgi:Cd2+/Zn2+-exporting ATPase